MTSREIIRQTLKGGNPERAGRQIWLLPWALDHSEQMVDKIRRDFPDDIVNIGCSLKKQPQTFGNPYKKGDYIDEYGCKYHNIQDGIVGECKEYLVNDDEWEDAGNIHIPEEWLTFDVAEVNENVKKYGADKWTIAGHCPRPFERLQFIRGTENFYIDLMTQPSKMLEFIEKLHDFYCRLLRKWAQTDVDALQFMDDWGSQRSLLINPVLWKEMFMPMYRDYIDIAHSAGKKIFMHSDGYILDILPSLIDMGLDAVNSQLFCMGVENLRQFRGKITFWGEIDRQNLLPYASTEEISAAVKKVYDNLWDNGYCIAQCEFGAGAKAENVYEVFNTWNKLTSK